MAPSLVGTAVGIDDAGRLIVEAGGERHTIVAGTVRDVGGTASRAAVDG
jgi:biotin-(acetyl-CoA carboxylase) ligase